MNRSCKICGEQFESTGGKQHYCNKDVVKVCPICGSEFAVKCNAASIKIETCSRECRNRLASMRRQESYSKNNVATCVLCGKEFNPRSNTQKICDSDHYRECVVCNKSFSIGKMHNKNISDIRTTCSDECLKSLQSSNNAFRDQNVRDKIKKTMLSRYGVEYAGQSSELVAKRSQTMIDRYGVAYMMQSDEGKEKIKATNMLRYGTEWATQSNEVKDKVVESNLSSRGVANVMQDPEVIDTFRHNYIDATGFSNPMQNPEVQIKVKQTNLERYGSECFLSSPEGKDKVSSTMLDRYGVENAFQSKEIRDKAAQTNLERYGAANYLSSEEGKAKARERMLEVYGHDSYSKSAEWKQSAIHECNNLDEWMKFAEDPEDYILTNYSSKPRYSELASDLGVRHCTVNDLIARKGLTHLISYSYSYMEDDIRNFLDSLSIQYQGHNRNVISPYEIDIYIPEFNFGIECNPTCTHNSSIPFMYESNDVLPTSYHKMKTDMCEAKGVNLLHIFGYDWTHKKDIILSMIRNRLGKAESVVYARKCKVVAVSSNDAITFLQNNHRQGAANSKVRLGLELDGQIVSLMTFGKMRSTIGKGNEDLDDCWELVRFCSLLNTSVVGGASKLLKAFINEYNPKRIRSFSDRAHTTGKLYSKLGFSPIRQSDPGYVWVRLADDKAYHRANTQKQNICKFLNDPSIDLTKTERQIMIEHNFVQVYDSGTITWELKL